MINIILNSLNKDYVCKKKNKKKIFFGEFYFWNRRKIIESIYVFYLVLGYFSIGLVVMKLNIYCYVVNKRIVILRNNK